MLEAINASEEQFVVGTYNVLRVVAAFPLPTNFKSRASGIMEALKEDPHPLALLSGSVLTAGIITKPSGCSILSTLNAALNRSQGKDDGDPMP
jgi:hypothetical protein